MKIRDAINMILWKYRNNLENYVLVIRDRLSSSGYKSIPFTYIKRVDRSYIYIEINDSITIIPLHRALRIEKESGEIVWKRND